MDFVYITSHRWHFRLTYPFLKLTNYQGKPFPCFLSGPSLCQTQKESVWRVQRAQLVQLCAPRVMIPLLWAWISSLKWKVRLTAYPPLMPILKGKNDTAPRVLIYEALWGTNVPLVAFLQRRGLQPVSDVRVSLIFDVENCVVIVVV